MGLERGRGSRTSRTGKRWGWAGCAVRGWGAAALGAASGRNLVSEPGSTRRSESVPVQRCSRAAEPARNRVLPVSPVRPAWGRGERCGCQRPGSACAEPGGWVPGANPRGRPGCPGPFSLLALQERVFKLRPRSLV